MHDTRHSYVYYIPLLTVYNPKILHTGPLTLLSPLKHSQTNDGRDTRRSLEGAFPFIVPTTVNTVAVFCSTEEPEARVCECLCASMCECVCVCVELCVFTGFTDITASAHFSFHLPT